jgi:sulfur transfer protein SufE
MYNTRSDIDRMVEVLKTATAHKSQSSPATGGNGDVAFAAAAAPSIRAAAAELAEDFESLPDREAKNSYVIDLGERLPNTFDTLKHLTTRVPGCMSEVYLIGRRAPGHKDVLEFGADANSDIVRGLIAIMQRLYSGQRATDVLTFDTEAFSAELVWISSSAPNAAMVWKVWSRRSGRWPTRWRRPQGAGNDERVRRQTRVHPAERASRPTPRSSSFASRRPAEKQQGRRAERFRR